MSRLFIIIFTIIFSIIFALSGMSSTSNSAISNSAISNSIISNSIISNSNISKFSSPEFNPPKSILKNYSEKHNHPKTKKTVSFADQRIAVTKTGDIIKENTFTDISMGKKTELYKD